MAFSLDFIVVGNFKMYSESFFAKNELSIVFCFCILIYQCIPSTYCLKVDL